MRHFAAIAFACLALAACSNTTASYPTVIADVQTGYKLTKTIVNAQIAAGKIPAADAAIIQKIEAVDYPLIASLSTTTAPTSIAAVLQDAQTLAAKLLPGTVATDAQTALAIAQAAYTTYVAASPVTN